VVSAGTDFRHIKGDSDEQSYALATGLTPLVHRVAGGTQNSAGVFAQDLIELAPKLQLTLSARLDRWRNFNAHDRETTLSTGLPVALVCNATTGVCTGNRDPLPDKSDKAVSPRVAALYRVRERVSLWGGVSRGFRAPTLKELYSPFRVGAVLTQSNETLGPERLTGGEAGISVAPTSALTVRGTWFNNRVNNPIANVTVGTNVRLLKNLGSTNIAGFQTDAAYRVSTRVSVSGAYVFENAKVHASVPDSTGTDLTGKVLAEVPKNRGSFQVTFTDPKLFNLSWDTEFVGMQFDDDLNVAKILPGLPGEKVGLPAYSVTNLTVSRTINHQMDVFIGAQNLFGTTYYVGTAPTTIGTPRLVNGGVRLTLGR
jgi:iron complex outermembrane receptor protein